MTGQTFSNGPNKELGFEIDLRSSPHSFIPTYYPSSFTQTKKKELNRYGGSCGGESVTIKAVKNRELHATGIILESKVDLFHRLMDHRGKVDLLSPLTPNGGLECFVKNAELGEQKGWDPQQQQWLFEYTLDFVSTGRDEYGSDRNAIVTPIIDDRLVSNTRVPGGFEGSQPLDS